MGSNLNGVVCTGCPEKGTWSKGFEEVRGHPGQRPEVETGPGLSQEACGLSRESEES